MSEAVETHQNPPTSNGHKEMEEAPAPPAKPLPSDDAPQASEEKEAPKEAPAPAPAPEAAPAPATAPASDTEEKMEVDAVDGQADGQAEAEPAPEAEEPKDEAAKEEKVEEKPAEAEKVEEKSEEKKEETSSSPEKKQGDSTTTNTQETTSPKKGRSPKKTKTPTPTATSTRSPRKAASASPAKSPAKDTPSAADSTPKKPVLEQPLTTEGKRQRRSVERWTEERTQTVKEFSIPNGRGTKLGDIEYVEAMISKTPSEVLKTLHRLCFGVVGKNTLVKKHLRQFNGYEFKDGSEDAKRKTKSLEGMQQKGLKQVCELLGLERSKTKEEIVKSIFTFLLCPADSGKKLPAKKGKKRRSSTGAKKGGKKEGKKQKGKKEESGDDESGEGSGSESGEEEEEEQEPAPKKAKKEKETPAKGRGRPKKEAGPKPPSDTELKKAIKVLLKGVNLESVTMKEMCKKVYDHFPGVDLAPRKDFIKSSVKEIISSSD